MIRMTAGTNSVATIVPKINLLPRKLIRASAYAASVAVATISSSCVVAASTLLKNQRSTGVSDEPSIASYAAVVGLAGIHCGSGAIASAWVLNDVTAIQINGLTNSRVSRISTTYCTTRLAPPGLRAGRPSGAGAIVEVPSAIAVIGSTPSAPGTRA